MVFFTAAVVIFDVYGLSLNLALSRIATGAFVSTYADSSIQSILHLLDDLVLIYLAIIVEIDTSEHNFFGADVSGMRRGMH